MSLLVPNPSLSALRDLRVALEKVEEGSSFVDAHVLNVMYRGTAVRGEDIGISYPLGKHGEDVARHMAPVSRHLEAALTLIPSNCVWALYTTFSNKARCEIYAAQIGLVAKQKDSIAKTPAMATVRACIIAWITLLELKERLSDDERAELPRDSAIETAH